MMCSQVQDHVEDCLYMKLLAAAAAAGAGAAGQNDSRLQVAAIEVYLS
jgi:hypothetical protein